MILVGSVRTDQGWSFDAYGTVLRDARQWSLLWRSLLIAIGAALGATILGAPIGFAISYFRVQGHRLLVPCVAVPFLIPPYIATIAWIDLLGRNGFVARTFSAWSGLEFPTIYGIGGVIFVLSLAYFPLVTLTTAVALMRFDHRLREAGQLVSGSRRVLWRIVVPLVAPSILAGALFVYVLSLIGLGTPSLLQVDTYPVLIYVATTYYDTPSATAQAIPLVVCGVLALILWRLYLRPRQAWLTGASRPTRQPQGRPVSRGLLALWCWLTVAVAAGVPVAVLVARSLPLSTFGEVWLAAKGEIGVTLLIAAGSATLLVVMAIPLALSTRHTSRLGNVYSLSLVPFLMSGPMLGLGLIALWNRSDLFGYVYGSLLIVVLACVARYLFFAHQGIASALKDLHPSLEESAAVAGVPRWRSLTGITLPLLRPMIAAVWGIGFVFALRELDAAVLVAPPGPPPLAVRLFTLMHYGPSRLVAALSLVTVVIILATAGVTMVCYQHWKWVSDAGR
jgi:iron(III) transport system permease protein